MKKPNKAASNSGPQANGVSWCCPTAQWKQSWNTSHKLLIWDDLDSNSNLDTDLESLSIYSVTWKSVTVSFCKWGPPSWVATKLLEEGVILRSSGPRVENWEDRTWNPHDCNICVLGFLSCCWLGGYQVSSCQQWKLQFRSKQVWLAVVYVVFKTIFVIYLL